MEGWRGGGGGWLGRTANQTEFGYRGENGGAFQVKLSTLSSLLFDQSQCTLISLEIDIYLFLSFVVPLWRLTDMRTLPHLGCVG